MGQDTSHDRTAEPDVPRFALALGERDFKLLDRERARNPEYNQDRLDVRRRLGELGKAIGADLAATHGIGLDVHTSLHHPASFNAFAVDHLRVYFSRDKTARRALAAILGSEFKKDIDSAYRHVCLGITMTADGFDTMLTLHPDAWWDAQNLVGKATRGEGGIGLANALNRATGFTLRVHEHRPHPTGAIRRDELERALKHFRIGEHYLRCQRHHERAAMLALDDQARGATLAADLVTLLPALEWIAWSPTNDFLFAPGTRTQGAS